MLTKKDFKDLGQEHGEIVYFSFTDGKWQFEFEDGYQLTELPDKEVMESARPTRTKQVD